MAASGYQLSTFLYGLYAGRRRMPALPQHLPEREVGSWMLGVDEGPVLLAPQCNAVQVNATTCGSASIALAKASDPASSEAALLGGVRAVADQAESVDADLAGSDAAVQSAGAATQDEFRSLQLAIKSRTNRRKWFFAWPQKYGTPPWGASREMRFAQHEYFDRMVVDTSLPQSTRVLTHAAQCALRGFPVLLYVGGDTSMGWDAGVPRHVVVLHSPPAAALAEDETTDAPIADDPTAEPAPEPEEPVSGADVESELERKLADMEARIAAKLAEAKRATDAEEFNPEFLIYEPSRGKNWRVTFQDLLNHRVPREAFGGWPHITWAVMPKPTTQQTS